MCVCTHVHPWIQRQMLVCIYLNMYFYETYLQGERMREDLFLGELSRTHKHFAWSNEFSEGSGFNLLFQGSEGSSNSWRKSPNGARGRPPGPGAEAGPLRQFGFGAPRQGLSPWGTERHTQALSPVILSPTRPHFSGWLAGAAMGKGGFCSDSPQDNKAALVRAVPPQCRPEFRRLLTSFPRICGGGGTLRLWFI